MYIWILLATIMVALSFYNVSPRADKDHALNEVRAATVSNRFKIEHKAMLKTMECEIMYHRNDGCWDSVSSPGDARYCTENDERKSAQAGDGAVDVSCFNPIYYKKYCSGRHTKTVDSDVMQTFFGVVQTGDNGGNTGGNENTETGEEGGTGNEVGTGTGNEVGTGTGSGEENVGETGTETPTPSVIPTGTSNNIMDNLIVDKYNYFTKHVPFGYDTEKSVFPKGVHHYVYCLDEVAERAKSDNFVRCDMKVDSNYDKSKTTEKTLSSRTRYLVSFAQMSEKWLSKKDRSPLPVLVNMLAKDNNTDMVFGWTVCDGQETPKCKLYGLNARHGNIRRKEDSKHYDVTTDPQTGEKKITKKQGETGVSVDIGTFNKKFKRDQNGDIVYDANTGKPVYEDERTTENDYVVDYEKLPDDSVFWANQDFIEDCKATPCMFAYQRIPAIDTAYHCYNLMVGFMPDKIKTNDWKNKHEGKPINVSNDDPVE